MLPRCLSASALLFLQLPIFLLIRCNVEWFYGTQLPQQLKLTDMTRKKPQPGVSRENRISDEGLKRLERQLRSGAGISDMVLEQWIKRYGDAAREIIKKYQGK